MKKLSFFLFSIFFFLFSTRTALAVKTEVGEANNLAQYVSLLLHELLPLIGGIALLMIIYAGYIYMTSQGNPEALGRAKDIIIGVVTGIVLLFLIGAIMSQLGAV